MYCAYFLVPGLRLPEGVYEQIAQKTDFSGLSKLTEGAEDILEQTLVDSPVLRGATHLVWLWQVIGKSRGMPETAAFEWEADGGPAMGAETWRLHSVHDDIKDSETILRSPTQELTETERDALHDEVLAIAREFGFQLQQWADRWYLTRNKDWQVAVRPWCAQKYRPFSVDSIEGTEADQFKAMDQKLRALLKESSVNVQRKAAGLETIDAFWPDGGSRRHLLKPSTLRAVMGNDAFIWGWAQNAGLLNFRTTALKNDWPEAPEGDLLAVADGLWESYRKKDWETWSKELPQVMQTVAHLAELARARRANRLVLVASGEENTHTVVVNEAGGAKGLFARFKKKKPLNLQAYLKEVTP